MKLRAPALALVVMLVIAPLAISMPSYATTPQPSVTTTVDVGTSPDSVAASPNGDYVYVTNDGSGTVSIINTSTDTVVDTIAVGRCHNLSSYPQMGITPM